MIVGIGIDAVEIERFSSWHRKQHASLKRIFSEAEITYCLASSSHSAQRFAARFAAREAIYKALSPIIPNISVELPFLTLACMVIIDKHASGAPRLLFTDCHDLNPRIYTTIISLHWHISLSHTKTMAFAYVIAENRTV